MNHKSIQDIFPNYYFPVPDEEEIARLCRAHFSTAQTLDDLTRWIQQTTCPYLREAYAEGMYQLILHGTESDDDELRINNGMREEVDAALYRIIRYSRTDQLAAEMYQSETAYPSSSTNAIPTNNLYDHIRSMEQHLQYLTQEVEQIKQEKETHPTFLWPYYAANVDVEDKQVFENQLRKICQSGKKTLTAELKMYIDMKKKQGMITRPTQMNSEYEVVKLFGYPNGPSAYYKG